VQGFRGRLFTSSGEGNQDAAFIEDCTKLGTGNV
jgi:hypothetical protein